MKLLFVHQNMPGQYRELIKWLVQENDRLRSAGQTEHTIVALSKAANAKDAEGYTTIKYTPDHAPKKDAYALSKVWEAATALGYSAAMALQEHEAKTGFRPDLILGHTGWGEMLFLKQVWPDVPSIGFFEYFYLLEGGDVGFTKPANKATPFLLQARNAVPYASLHCVDKAVAPTQWQHDTYPDLFRDKMYVCHDGIRSDILVPEPDARLKLTRLERELTCADEVFTYVARNMEPTRGFKSYMHALPKILNERPDARAIIVGDNKVSYGAASKHKNGFRGEMEAELGDSVDWERVHFVGRTSYADFCKIIQLSTCHIYLTVPFILSWSLLEAMSMGAVVVANDVEPVKEAITHQETGLLVDFFDSDALAKQVVDVLARPKDYAHIGQQARDHVVKTYDFLSVCLPQHLEQMNALVAPDLRIEPPNYKHITKI